MKLKSDKFFKVSLLSILLLGFVLRVFRLSSLNLWRDEAFSVDISKHSFLQILSLTAKDTQPPLHVLSLHYWIELFNDSEFSVRFLSLIFGVLTIIFTYKLSKLFFKSQKYQLLSTLFVAINPFLIVYSQEARAYSMLTFFFIASLYYLLKYIELNRVKDLVAFIVFNIFGLYTHNIFVVITFSFILIYLLNYLRNNKKFSIKKVFQEKANTSFLIALITIGIFYIPWLVTFFTQYSKIKDEGFWLIFDPGVDVFKNILFLFISNSFDYDLTIFDYLSISLIILFGIVVSFFGMYSELSKSKKNFPYLSLSLLIILVSIFFISFQTPFFHYRYIIFCSPIFLVLNVNGLKTLAKITSIKFAYFVSALFVISNLYFYLFNISQNIYKEDYTNAISQLDYNENTDIIMHSQIATFHSFKYYSDLESFIFDPNRTQPYYYGITTLKDSDYYFEGVKEFNRVWVFNQWLNPELENYLSNSGFTKVNTHGFHAGLFVELWTTNL